LPEKVRYLERRCRQIQDFANDAISSVEKVS
jgi:hypothetical protein